jgi:hypothetical protein
MTYYLDREPEEEVRLTVSDSNGNQIKVFSSEKNDTCVLKAKAGFNRFVWDMRYPASDKLSDDGGALRPEVTVGPLSPPGNYRVEISTDGQSSSESFEILKDPRILATQDDLEAQFELLIKIRDKISDIHNAVDRLRNIRIQVNEWEQRADGHQDQKTLSEAALALKASLSALENELVKVKPLGGAMRGGPVRLNAKVAWLTQVVSSADWAPTSQSYAVFDDVSIRIEGYLQELQRITDTDLKDFIRLVDDLRIPAIIL